MPNVLRFPVLLAFTLYLPFSPAFAAQTDPVPDSRIEGIIHGLTLEQKIDLIGGVDGFYARGLPSINLPRMKMDDGPLGARNDGPATAMAGGIGLAATWNPELARAVGLQIGRDARARGAHFMLGPGVNIYKSGRNGRNFEYFGEDPFLASRMAVGYIEGMQSQGVSATVKHFLGNNSEFDRHNVDSVIDERTLREIYLPAFEAAIREAHVGAVMDSYNLVNGQHMTQNGYFNTDVVKKQWGFDGLIMSDWLATYDGVAAANGGLDLEMPAGLFMNKKNLLPAVQSGKVSEATIDDKVRRILRTAARFGWMDRDQQQLEIPLDNPQGGAVALAAAREAVVLLKNDNGLLPLDTQKAKTIAVIGPDAYPAVPDAGGSAQVVPFTAVSFLQGLSAAYGAGGKVLYSRGIGSWNLLANMTKFVDAPSEGKPGLTVESFGNETLTGAAVATERELHISRKPSFAIADLAEMDMGDLFAAFSSAPAATHGTSKRWTGYYVATEAGAYEVFAHIPGESGGFRIQIDGKTVVDDWTIRRAMLEHVRLHLTAGPHKFVFEQHSPGAGDVFGGAVHVGIAPVSTIVSADAKKLAKLADVVVLCVGFDPDTESEGSDRTLDLPFGQEELIREIAAVNKNVVVVVTAGGAVDTSRWLHDVPGLIQAWYPGQNGGTALADVLLGRVDPSGRLPISYESGKGPTPSEESYYPAPGTNRVEYKDGVFVGYRGYEHIGTQPAFPFGYGLSYTQFKYDNVKVVTDGGEGHFTVSFDVTNTGTRDGKDVAQLYVAPKSSRVPRPVKELKAFGKVDLRPGETKRVSLTLQPRAFAYYDVEGKQWLAEKGEYGIEIGESSQKIVLRDRAKLAQDLKIPVG